MRLPAIERWLVTLIAIHSFAVGVMLLFFPMFSVRFGGWGHADQLFFTRQAGAFHLVVALGYLLEYRRNGTVTLLVCTKALAFVFLVSAFALGERAWAVPLSGLADGAMGLVAFLVHRFAARTPLGGETVL